MKLAIKQQKAHFSLPLGNEKLDNFNILQLFGVAAGKPCSESITLTKLLYKLPDSWQEQRKLIGMDGREPLFMSRTPRWECSIKRI